MISDNPNPNKKKILIVDDLPPNIDLLREELEPENRVLVATNSKSALRVAHDEQPDLILLDVVMPKIDGFETCRRLKNDRSTADIPIIFVTVKDATEDVVKGFRVGGVDYIQRPFKKEELLARVNAHLKINQLTKELIEKNTVLEQEISKRELAEDALQIADEHLSVISKQEAQRWGLEALVGKSQPMAEIRADILRLQPHDSTGVLITGESGTGKELIARAIHFGGKRKKAPFIAVNCSAIPAELAESELFGHVRGAFSGATESRKGRFELANSGTLFLDELGEMPLALQTKLLRVLEEDEVTPVGGTQARPIRVRVIAATNANPQAKIAEGTLRRDLYYRLAQFPIEAPPLRQRREDIPLLVEHFLEMFAAEMGRSPVAISPEALEMLNAYPFPGNVRELKNIIEHALILSGGTEIQPQHLYFTPPHPDKPPLTSHADFQDTSPVENVSTMPLNLKQAEAILIRRALEQAHGNKTEAAKALGIDRKTLYNKIDGLI